MLSSSGTTTQPGAKFIFDYASPEAGNLYYDADGSGAIARVLIATITFTAADMGNPDPLAGVFGWQDFAFV